MTNDTPPIPYCYDEQGKPVQHGDIYLKSLWTNIAKCGLENREEDSKFDPEKFYRPIQVALSHVDALLTVVQECRKNDGKVSLLKGDPDTKPLIVSHDRRSMYIESAANLRHQAQLLSATFSKLEAFLEKYVKPLMNAGFQVDYTTDSIWVVDFGFKQMFPKFGAHFDPVVSRGHYAVIDLDKETGKFTYKFPQELLVRIIHVRDGQEEGLPDLFPVDERLTHDDELVVFAGELSKYRQSVLEASLCDHLINSKLKDEEELKLMEGDPPMAHSVDLLQALEQYLGDHQ